MKLHPKVQQLQLKAKPINVSGSYVDEQGNLHLADFRIAILSEEDRTIKGYLAVFGNKDLDGEMFIRGAFAKSIKERGPESNAKAKIALLWQHEIDEPLGQFTKLTEDEYGLYFEAVLDPIPQADRALIQIKSGTLNQFSVGFKYMWDKVEYDQNLDVFVIKEVVLYEGSIVTIGANPETYVVKAMKDLVGAKEALDAETETILQSLPKNKQLEFRQLLSKHISIAQLQASAKNLKTDEPEEVFAPAIGDYKLDINNL